MLRIATAEPLVMFSANVDFEVERSDGDSFRSSTLSLNDFSKVRSLESVVSNRIEYEGLDSKSGDSLILS